MLSLEYQAEQFIRIQSIFRSPDKIYLFKNYVAKEFCK